MGILDLLRPRPGISGMAETKANMTMGMPTAMMLPIHSKYRRR